MAKTQENINIELFDLLRAKGFDPEGVKQLKSSIKPSDATGFNFHFKVDNKEYGSAHIAVDDMNTLILFYNRDAMREVSHDWSRFIKELKNWAMRHGLSWQLDSLDNLEHYYVRKDDKKQLDEGYYGNKTTSYSDRAPKTLKLIIKHNRNLDENDQRFRYVDKIFLENSDGERFLLPTKKPSIAHVYARHLANGGNLYDERAKHIQQIEEDIGNLSGFVRATRNKQFNESVNSIVEAALQKYQALRGLVKQLQHGRGYKKYFETWQPTLNETENSGIGSLADAFRQSKLDPRIERALPTLSRHDIHYQEMSEGLQFERWADQMLEDWAHDINEELVPNMPGQIEELVDLLNSDEKISLGPDASNILGQLDDIIQEPSLESRLQRAAEADPENDAKPIIIGWIQEHADQRVYQDILDQLSKTKAEVSTEPELSQEPRKPLRVQTRADKSGSIANPATQSSSVPPISATPPILEDDEISRLRRLISRK